MKSLKLCLACIMVFLLLLAGCAKSEKSDNFSSMGAYDDGNSVSRNSLVSPSAPSYEAEESIYGGSYDYADEAGYNTVADITEFTSRKVIFSYNYELETTDMDVTLSALESSVQASGGYIENASYSGRAENDQYSVARLTCRIPTSSVGEFRRSIESAGHVRAKSEYGQDVTDVYFDTEAHLNSLIIQEERLLELLEQSGNLSDLLEIERELARVRTDIEYLTGTLNKYDNLIDLTTFSINVYNVSEYTPPVDETFWTRLGRSALDSLQSALGVAQNLVIVLVYLLPYLVVGGLIALVIILIVRNRRKKRPPRQLPDYWSTAAFSPSASPQPQFYAPYPLPTDDPNPLQTDSSDLSQTETPEPPIKEKPSGTHRKK